MVFNYKKTHQYLKAKIEQLGAAKTENIFAFWASSNFLPGITSLQFMVAGCVFLLFSKIGPGKAVDLKTERKYWSLCFTVILLLSDVKFRRLKYEIDLERDRLDCHKSENTSAISAICKRSEEALRRLAELEQVIQQCKEQHYILDSDDDQNDGDYPDDDNYDEDDILGHEDQDEEYEG